MALAGWLRDRLWRSDNWCAELARLRQAIATEPRTARTIERMLDLATATELCDPDRGRALALYLDAWRAGHTAARERAHALAIALRAHMTVAELALADGDLLAAGVAYLDGGFPELAIDPLEKFAAARPEGASVATEKLGLEGVRALLALARRGRFDAAREVADSLARTQHASGRAAVPCYVHAARIARLARLADQLPAILSQAWRTCPDDDEIAALIEIHHLEQGNVDALIEHYKTRFERAASRTQYVERMHAAAVELIASGLSPGLGLRLLRMSLEQAYEALLPDVTSHIAAWELLLAHARTQRSTPDLVPLIVKALAAPLSEDVALYLGRLGLEIVWRDAGDSSAAQPYAAMLLDFVPDHPLATAFAKQIAPAPESGRSPEAVAPPPAAAPAPPPAAAPAPPPFARPAAGLPPDARTTARMHALDQGTVKRVASTSPAKNLGVTSRLALLRPPPARATSLDRDRSPIPSSPAPAVAPASLRAPRRVVPIDVVVELDSGAFFSTTLRDVSTSGAFIVTKRALEVGTVLTLELKIPTTGTMSQSSHRVNARIARRTDVGCGLAFIDPSPELVAAIEATTRE